MAFTGMNKKSLSKSNNQDTDSQKLTVFLNTTASKESPQTISNSSTYLAKSTCAGKHIILSQKDAKFVIMNQVHLLNPPYEWSQSYLISKHAPYLYQKPLLS